MARAPQTLQPCRRLGKLISAGALREIAGNDDEIGPGLRQPRLRPGDDRWIMGAEVDVGEMRDAGHDPA